MYCIISVAYAKCTMYGVIYTRTDMGGMYDD